MSRGFDGADLTLCSARDYGKAGFHGAPLEFGIDFVVAEEFFADHVLLIVRMQEGSRTQANVANRS